MGSKRTTWPIGISTAVLLLLLSCDVLAAPRERGGGLGRGFGPPAHAPAYGYRNKVVYGYTLDFDPGFGLYIVVGLADCYYHEGHFYRWRGGVWEISLRADKWGPVGRDKMPAAMQLKAKSVAKYNSPGNDAAKPAGNGDIKATGDGKLNAGGNSDVKASGAKGNDPAKPNAVGGPSGSDTKPGGSVGSPAKPSGATDAKPNATSSSSTKPSSTGTNSAKPSGQSGGSGKTKNSGRGRR